MTFDQTSYFNDATGLADSGYWYLPSACAVILSYIAYLIKGRIAMLFTCSIPWIQAGI